MFNSPNLKALFLSASSQYQWFTVAETLQATVCHQFSCRCRLAYSMVVAVLSTRLTGHIWQLWYVNHLKHLLIPVTDYRGHRRTVSVKIEKLILLKVHCIQYM